MNVMVLSCLVANFLFFLTCARYTQVTVGPRESRTLLAPWRHLHCMEEVARHRMGQQAASSLRAVRALRGGSRTPCPLRPTAQVPLTARWKRARQAWSSWGWRQASGLSRSRIRTWGPGLLPEPPRGMQWASVQSSRVVSGQQA